MAQGSETTTDMAQKQQETVALKRSLTLPLVVFYGLGNILGAGIYVLVGKVAGQAGLLAPFSMRGWRW